MSIFQRTVFLSLIIILLLSCLSSLAFASSDLTTKEDKLVETDRGDYRVNYIKIPLAGDYGFTTSYDEVGTVDSLSSHAQREDGIAAINGTFFDAYTSEDDERYPSGAIMKDGQLLHLMGFGSTFAVKSDDGIKNIKDLDVSRMRFGLNLVIEDRDIRIGRINHPSDNSNMIIAYTPEFSKDVIDEQGTKLVVENNRIVEFTDGPAEIPENGFVVELGTQQAVSQLPENYSPGDKAKLKPSVSDEDREEPIEIEDFIHMVGAGPKLVNNGREDVDLEKDQMTGERHTIKARRSFIGYNDNEVIMGTVDGANHEDTAAICVELGLTEAMALDGGASSGLYYEGDYITRPGREISNALVVNNISEPEDPGMSPSDGGPGSGVGRSSILELEPGNYTVKKFDSNRSEQSKKGSWELDSAPIIRDGRTLMPLRGVIDKLGASLDWDNSSQEVTIKDDGVEVKLTIGETTAKVNGESKIMEISPIIEDSRTLIPLRYANELLGHNVDWISGEEVIEIRTK
ncbi:stalk domain-containing protein [Natranaerobius thermophilus]|uniref:Copper amine oxidase domain protein n=1 Tax=Natranaerobius thermophilus (strain ATCC BAA-1301 / DSM 18059 / JW/NM-WN-LF) TaxID=457570 RepID=B2A2E0_NATTJ|nr:stalk domain-containing protein [Natranaerobius thermophilus]ACB86246.1 copper amine oxidase domain protein [Natranaerobius thermophilus JW/NM-WN-LF]